MIDNMEEKSIVGLNVRRFIFGFVIGGIVFSGIGFGIRGEHMSNLGTFLVGFGVAFVLAVVWVLIGLLMEGETRSGSPKNQNSHH